MDFRLQSQAFPPPPTVDHPEIKPIANPADLRRAALRFENCLRDYQARIVEGELAFYVYDGAEPAVVSVRPCTGGRHVVDQIRGVKNLPVAPATQKAIRKAFTAGGIGGKARQARREAIDSCLINLSRTTTNVDEEIDEVCNAYLEQREGEGEWV